jgi:ketosteroid isomerase-like protein
VRSSVAIAFAAVLCACAPSASLPAGSFDRAEVESAVQEGMASYAAALGTLDSARILSHYVAAPEFRLVSDGASYSYEGMQRLIGSLRGALRGSEVRWDTLVVTVLGPDAGLVYAPFRRVDTDTAGRVTRVRGVATWLWVRREGRWHSLYGHGDHYPDTTGAR